MKAQTKKETKKKAVKKEAPKKAASKKPVAKDVKPVQETKLDIKPEEAKAEEVKPEVKPEEVKTEEVKAEPVEASAVVASKPVEPESDFADEEKAPEPIKKEEPAAEAKPQEPAINLYKEDAEVAPEVAAPVKGNKKAPEKTYTYGNEDHAKIEKARVDFYKIYKHENLIKWIVTTIVLVVIILGYVLPFSINGIKDQTWAIYITLGVLVVAIICLGVYSWLSKKKLDKCMNDYFAQYYELANKATFEGLGVSNVTGNVADKITPTEFSACGLYKNVYKVGSRDKLTFTYHNTHMTIVDCAAQTKGQKSLVTEFVGKMLVAPNSYNGDDVVVYLKGNKRALPPNGLEGYSVLEDHKDYVIYGISNKKKALTQKVRAAISEIHTDATLVDCAIAIKPGNTYFLMGYEDTLMVLPLEKPFNPAPSEKFHEDLKKCLAVADAIDSKAN